MRPWAGIAFLLVMGVPVVGAQGVCDGPVVPVEGDAMLDAVVGVSIDHPGGLGTARVCVTDGDGVLRASREVDLEGPGPHRLEFEVPAARHAAWLDLGSGTVMATLDPQDCPTRAQEATFVAGQGGLATGPKRCFEPTGQAGQAPPLKGGRLWVVAAGVAGLLAVGALGGRRLRLLALALFTRLHQSSLLQQHTRARIAGLVRDEPGIHAADVARRLALGRGTTDYHLDVLHRERLVARLATQGMVHWFEAGRFTPTAMQALATLRSPACRQAFIAIRAKPGIRAGDLARLLGISASAGSKATRRLRNAGLVASQATPAGTLLAPTPASSLLPMTTVLRDHHEP